PFPRCSRGALGSGALAGASAWARTRTMSRRNRTGAVLSVRNGCIPARNRQTGSCPTRTGQGVYFTKAVRVGGGTKSRSSCRPQKDRTSPVKRTATLAPQAWVHTVGRQRRKEHTMSSSPLQNWLRTRAQQKRRRKAARPRPPRRLRPRVEPLEERVLLDSTQAFPVPLDPLRPFGSLLFTGSHADRIDPAGETDS